MATLKSSCEPPGGLCGQNAASSAKVGVQAATRTTPQGELIITGSFDGLLERIAQIDYFDVWLSGTKILKKAKKERIEATMRLSEASTLTGLTAEDAQLFVSFSLVEVAEAGEDPLLSFRDVFFLLKTFERFVG